MGEKLVVGPVSKGLSKFFEPFNIDNDSFPILINAYQWRGRIKRKRGTSLLGRLHRFLANTDGSGNLTITISPQPILTGIVSFIIGTDIFVDPGTTANPGTQTLLTNSAGSGTLNRVTGVLTITGSQASTAVFYFPRLPVMGLRELTLGSTQSPGTLAFDTTYSYNIQTTDPYGIYDVSFFKNPPTGTYPAYVQKSTATPLNWNGQDYQQFGSINYQNAFWVTNGVRVPFNSTNIGMQFIGPTTAPVALTAIARITATTVNFTAAGNNLVVGDFVFTNEITASGGGSAQAINLQTGYVTTAGNTFTVTFPNANIPAGTYNPGILQYLTNNASPTLDCIRWYDGDPTNGSPTVPVVNGTLGWVNFMPPLSNGIFSIADLPQAIYYLVGAKILFNFKDRLMAVGPVVQSSTSAAIYLKDTVIFSQNGTPYYTASFTADPTLINTVFNQILVPVNQTATANAWFEDLAGLGGFVSNGVDEAINTCSPNEDVLIMGFDESQARFVFTGNDLLPFNFYLINAEKGSQSTFSTINMDDGVITRGTRGYTQTNQVRCDRIDIEIPDQVFEIRLTQNGNERFTAIRDYENEWLYFTYTPNQTMDSISRFPGQTLFYNYREESWAIFNESYTTYGIFRRSTGFTWATIGNTYPTWSSWNTPWNSGDTTLLQQEIIAGNQQGYILFRSDGDTSEATSLYIQNITSTQITSPDHGLNTGDFILITGVLGTIAAGVNNKIFQVVVTTENSFLINPPVPSGTYQGGGMIQRMYVPFIQTKQFPMAWGIGRKTRIGPQQYLLSRTVSGQITLLIFLSQDSDNPWNEGPIVPDPSSINDSLIYSTVLFTCPESTNIGLTAANVNLQMPTSTPAQLWHRVNTSLLGDTVQLGFTLSDAQMKDPGVRFQFAEIELHGFVLDVNPSQVLA